MKSGIQIQDRDLDILETIFDLRYVLAEHITALHPSTNSDNLARGQFRQGGEALEKRLRKLSKFKYLHRLGPPHRRYSEPPVYFLGPQSIQLLANERGYDPELIKEQLHANRKYLTSKSLNKQSHLEHALGINTFHVALTLALRDEADADWLYHENGAPYWIEPTSRDLKKKLAPTITVKNNDIPKAARNYLRPSGEQTRITRNPDAMFILNLDGHRVGYFYEKDRGSESHAVIAAKMFCYLEWYRQQRPQHVFGTKHLRILIETESDKRIDNMVQTLLKINEKGSGIFWFTASNNINLETPSKTLKPIWTVGHVKYLMEKHSLIEFKRPER